jgi:hypothetical protein
MAAGKWPLRAICVVANRLHRRMATICAWQRQRECMARDYFAGTSGAQLADSTACEPSVNDRARSAACSQASLEV